MSKEKVGKKKKKTKREKGLRANVCGIWNNNKSLFFLLVNAEMAMYDRIQSVFIYGNSYITFLFIY
jgi:hypothetical protein